MLVYFHDTWGIHVLNPRSFFKIRIIIMFDDQDMSNIYHSVFNGELFYKKIITKI
jgi:hypothetical protein